MLMDGTLPAAPACIAPATDSSRLRMAFVHHYAGVWRFLRRMGVQGAGADDAAQQVFLIALEALPRIVHGSERAFLYATAVRIAHGVRRQPARQVGGLDLELTGPAAS